MHRVDAFRNSPGVCRKLGWCKGVRQKKIETCRKIVRDSRKAFRDSNDAVGSRQKFARRFAEGIGKLTGNAKVDRWKKDRRTCRKIAGGCRSMREIRAMGSSFRRINHPGGW
ncbi:hypothetical protein GW17_00004863 [Ensete ventricosum]|nr:hypothetical protein GW17_00004863 [Ensete ventricosum]